MVAAKEKLKWKEIGKEGIKSGYYCIGLITSKTALINDKLMYWLMVFDCLALSKLWIYTQ